MCNEYERIHKAQAEDIAKWVLYRMAMKQGISEIDMAR